MKSKKKRKTGYIYDTAFLKHTRIGHPENSGRLKSICKQLENSSLLERLVPIEGHPAPVEELATVHTEAYIEKVRRACRSSSPLDPDTYTCHGSYDAAVRAAGGLVDLTQAVLNRRIRNGIALIRPPGHHALPDRAMGFCIFNNIAIGVKIAQQKYKIRTAIVDFDIHHGNGTQAVFESDPSVLYISSHAYPFYPGTGAIEQTGSGKGEGSIINIPLPHRTGDTDIKTVYNSIVVPAVRRFEPDILFAVAGYDAHWRDPLGVFDFSSTCLAWISSLLVELADDLCSGKIVFALSGGYDTQVLAVDVANSVQALCGNKNFEDPFGPSPNGKKTNKKLDSYIAELRTLHRL
ncbi:histone deacetylase [candidate division KSB1 bacterium]|nr:histone deacetylase [candidate division KSB1 bacterium]